MAEDAPIDPNLQRVIDAWAELPEPTKAAVLAVIDSATKPKAKPARTRKD